MSCALQFETKNIVDAPTGDRAIGRGRSDDPEARLYVDEVKDKFKRLQVMTTRI